MGIEEQPKEWTEAEKSWARPADKKYDQGKPMVGLMQKDFSKALMLVADVSRYGVEKYKEPGSWLYVDDGFNRYLDAMGRHLLLSHTEQYDEESGHPHLAHHAWNALAILQFKAMETE